MEGRIALLHGESIMEVCIQLDHARSIHQLIVTWASRRLPGHQHGDEMYGRRASFASYKEALRATPTPYS